MKKVLALLLSVMLVASCSLEDDSPDFQFEILPVESVIMPAQFTAGVAEEISLTFIRPTGCHIFNDFYYVSDGNQRTVAVVASVSNSSCETDINEEVEVSFDFLPQELYQSYTFRFWQGVDENEEDVYYTVEVPVIP